ncbi:MULTISPECIES: APC family permease [unclassified Leclercia]|uniref:Amino acid permease n=1 Tax=Leclercia barmai TaxID=2785629 RepID=A0ABS7RZ25_9ENTR|nr:MULTISPECIES: APC family permease [unclassified Leclercia]MBZ0059535.1 amino acid permease [Leclercia sp. EMC7]MCM5697331.1 APC family permease [Leclercia sp. LTM01]MCM5702071.1 APC family permease [Leclercia sp. LTM14]
MEQTPAKKAEHNQPDNKEQFTRSIGLVSNFALGFTYLSPLTAVYSLFALAITLAGPPAVWWILIVACGQLLVALVFGEVSSQYPITGGLYPWARRLWGKKYAWIAAWIYLWALVVTITSIAEYTATFVESLFHYGQTPMTMLLTSAILLLLMMAINMSGTKNLARVARIGFWCEIVSVIALGIYLLIFHRAQPFSVVFDSMGVMALDGSYTTAFMSAALMGLFMFFGFEACGNVAEEVQNPGKKIPVAMILSIVFGAISAIISVLGYLLSSPNLLNIVNGKVADPIPAILNEALGETGATIFIVIAIIAMLSCILSLQAALSRLIFSFSRDKMLPGSEWMAKISRNNVPDNAMIVSCLLPVIVCVCVYFQPDNLARITAFAVIGIYISFQMVVLAAMRQRLKGWKPAGEWTIGGWGMLVNGLALAYGVVAIWLLAQPAEGSTFLDRWTVLIGLAIVLGAGLLYMAIARPFGRSSAPENDAIVYANGLKEKENY